MFPQLSRCASKMNRRIGQIDRTEVEPIARLIERKFGELRSIGFSCCGINVKSDLYALTPLESAILIRLISEQE